MSEVAKLTASPTGKPVPVPMQALIVGKIEAVTQYDGKRLTRVLCPAADLYSRPSVVQVRSTSRLGQKGDEISVTCTLSGYARKPYKSTDRETGEISMVTPVDHVLDLVE